MKPGRLFIHQGEMTKQSKSGKETSLRYYLFTDMLIAGKKTHNNKWIVLRKYVWNTVTVTDELIPLVFKINTGKSTANFITLNQEDKIAWINAFSKAGVSEEDLANATAPLQLAATKECLICLKSFNQIRKRYYCRNCKFVICKLCTKGSHKAILCDYCFEEFALTCGTKVFSELQTDIFGDNFGDSDEEDTDADNRVIESKIVSALTEEVSIKSRFRFLTKIFCVLIL
jgi:hypothetical protein